MAARGRKKRRKGPSMTSIETEVTALLVDGWRQLDAAWPGQLWMHSTRWGVAVTTPWRMPTGGPVKVVLMDENDEVVVCDMGAAAAWLHLRDPRTAR